MMNTENLRCELWSHISKEAVEEAQKSRNLILVPFAPNFSLFLSTKFCKQYTVLRNYEI